MASAFVNVQQGALSFVGTVATIAYTPAAAGNYLLVMVRWAGSISLNTVKDQNGNPFFEILNTETATGIGGSLPTITMVGLPFCQPGITSLVCTFQSTPSAAEYLVLEYSGLASGFLGAGANFQPYSASPRQAQTTPGTGTNAISSTAATPFDMPGQLIGITIASTNTADVVAGTNVAWNTRLSGNTYFFVEDFRQTSNVSSTAEMTDATLGATDNYWTIMLAVVEPLHGIQPVQFASANLSPGARSFTGTITNLKGGTFVTAQVVAYRGSSGGDTTPLLVPTDSNGALWVNAENPAGQTNGSATIVEQIACLTTGSIQGSLTVTFENGATDNITKAKLVLTEWTGIALGGPDSPVAGATNTTTANANTATAAAALTTNLELMLAQLCFSSGAGVSNAGINTPAGTGSQFSEQNTTADQGANIIAGILTTGPGATPSAAFTWTDGTTAFGQATIAVFKAGVFPVPLSEDAEWIQFVQP